MAETTKISWCDSTFNPWIGCAKVRPAVRTATRSGTSITARAGVKWGPSGTRSMTSEQNWQKPWAWQQQAKSAGVRRRVFCASLADVFEAWLGPIVNCHGRELRRCEYCQRLGFSDTCLHRRDERSTVMATMQDLRGRLWNIVQRTNSLDWLLLTKRPENVLHMIPVDWLAAWPANVGIGVSVEDQAAANARIPELLKIPSGMRFLSCEPLLGPLDLRLAPNALVEFDWVIAGGESGPRARPVHPDWLRGLRNQCQAAGLPFFFKQWGEWAPRSHGFHDGGDKPWGTHDGKVFMPQTTPWNGHDDDGSGEAVMIRAGKQAAGCLLDGREWKELPTWN